MNILSNRISPGEKLLRGVRSEKSYSPPFPHVIPVVEAALSYIESSDVSKGWIRSSHRQRRIVVIGMCADRILLEFRDGVFAIRRLRLNHLHIFIFPMD